MIDVSVLKCDSYDEELLHDRIKQSIENLGGLEKFVSRGDKVLIKPNLLSAKPKSTCITTHPVFVKAVANIIKGFGCDVVVGDSPPVHSAIKVAKKTGLYDELKSIGVELIEFTTPTKLTVGDGAVFKDIYVAKQVLNADCVINLPKIKSHTQMTYTGCVKNMFGSIIGKEKPMWHLKAGISKELFPKLLVELYLRIAPKLTIADMITVMEGNGPSSGTPKHIGAIVSGTDCIAMDEIILDILNVPAGHVYTQNEAKKLYPASTEKENINMISEGLNGIKRNAKGFKLAKRTELGFGIPDSFNRLLRDLLTSKPVIDTKKCIHCKACEEICPAHLISIEDGWISIDYDGCVKCFCCQEICAHKALKVKRGMLLKLFDMIS